MTGTPAYNRIRAATKNDLDAIRRIVKDAYAVYIPRIGREPAPMLANHAAQVSSGAVWVATNCSDEPLGLIVLRREPTALLLENVAVAPEVQGRGIGRALITFAEQRARDLGLKEVTLYTNEKMTENLRLYPALGYVQTSRRTDEGFERVFFSKLLAE